MEKNSARHPYEWRKLSAKKSTKIRTTVAIECPHCGFVMKVSSEVIRDNVSCGQLAMHFICPNSNCMSHSPLATDFDDVVFDLRPEGVTDDDMYREIRNETTLGKIYQNVGNDDSVDKWLSCFGWEEPECKREKKS